ncbi:hypothetical protein IWW48_005528 [Coemansia sp. RSA 1200]|nr:hypothetical protein IWW48_005528 [Coemansia sp. RSA 1200]
MRYLASFVLAAAAASVSAQDVGVSEGSKVSAGASAIDSPNINNGFQAESSLLTSGGSTAFGGNTLFNHVAGSQFTNVNENLSVQDNLVNNPGFTSVQGNNGWTADGDGNLMGPVLNDMRGGFAPLRKRAGDVVFANNAHHIASVMYSPFAPAAYYGPATVLSYPVSVVAPVYYAPIHKQTRGYTAEAPAKETPKYASKAPIVEQPKPEYKAPVAEQPKPEYKAPVAEQPKPDYHAPIAEQPKPEYKAPVAEQPKPEHKAPVAEQPKPEYKAPVAEQPKPEYHAPAAEQPKHVYPSPVAEKPVEYSASPITNIKYAKAL